MMTASKSHLEESEIDIDFGTGKIEISDPVPISFFKKMYSIVMTIWLCFGVPLFFVGMTFASFFYGKRVFMQERLGPAILFTILGLLGVIYIIGFIFIGRTTKMLAAVSACVYSKFNIVKSGELGANEFSFIFKNKFIYYTMEDDYADYRSKIEIKPIIETRPNGKKKVRFWTATFKFSQEPKKGRIEIFYN